MRLPLILSERRWITATICVVGLLCFAISSYTAALSKSATYDEVLHCVAGYVHRTMGDFRINPEDPALFGYWGSLCQSSGALKINTDYASWDQMIDDFQTYQWVFSETTLYQTPGNDGDAFLQRTRFMFVIVGVALGVVIAIWSWQLAGAWAAVGACLLFCFDPNFLAHSGLFKNDVMLSLVFLGTAFALWRIGRRGTAWNIAAIALCTAAAVNIKFSGLLLGPIIAALLLLRAALPWSWIIGRWQFTRLYQRLLAAGAIAGIVFVSCYLCTWACYRFRYLPTSNPAIQQNISHVVDQARINRARASFGLNQGQTNEAIVARAKEMPQSHLVTTLLWMLDHHALPQPWLFGFLFTYATTQVRGSYLLGATRITGWWYYFPAAMLFKTPLATLAAIPLLGITCGIGAIVRRWTLSSPSSMPPRTWIWSTACLLLPAVIYMGSAMSTNLNLGLRHVLPIYPFLFIGLGLALASLARVRSAAAWSLGGVLLLGLIAESAAAYPNYLSFFNTPSGGSTNGINLLADSNLDWGQDLKQLATWQKWHDEQPMYLAYFGMADPKFYGVKAFNVPGPLGGWQLETSPSMYNGGNAYFAVSATSLQCVYLNDPQVRSFYDTLRHTPPLAVLGGSIYVYQFPFHPNGPP